MVLIGALANAGLTLVGALLGLAFKSKVSDDLGDFLLRGQGLAVILVAVQGMMRGGSVVVVTIAMALGCLVGYVLDIDGWMRRLGDSAQRWLDARLAGKGALGSFSEGFVVATLFCCTGAMGIMGSLESGIQLSHGTLIAKGVIDLVVCIPFAATMGVGVPFAAVSIFVYEGLLSLLASVIAGFLTEAVITEMVVTGSLLLLVVGTNLLKITDLKVANMLPAAFMPIVLVPLMAALGLL